MPVCWPWWFLLMALVGAGLLGVGLCFVWYWWLVSRPGGRRSGNPNQGPMQSG